MTLLEKNLYQQIHPVRLITDWSSGLYACYLFWNQLLIEGLVAAFIPSLIVSLVILRFTDLEKLKNSKFGRYYKRIYNKTVDFTRFGGFVVMAAGSWSQSIQIAGVGLIIIIGTWTYGMFQTNPPKK
ncbi:MAG: hypothetical protein Q8L88_05860 [Bacteroidota bacterium]|nr:hypothetical protein [Bacteroidota bacterium]